MQRVIGRKGRCAVKLFHFLPCGRLQGPLFFQLARLAVAVLTCPRLAAAMGVAVMDE